MIEISKFYFKKSHSERTFAVLQEIIACEKLLKSNHFYLTGGACISINKLGSSLNTVDLAPELDNQLYEAVIQAVRDHIINLKQLKKQIDNEKEK